MLPASVRQQSFPRSVLVVAVRTLVVATGPFVNVPQRQCGELLLAHATREIPAGVHLLVVLLQVLPGTEAAAIASGQVVETVLCGAVELPFFGL